MRTESLHNTWQPCNTGPFKLSKYLPECLCVPCHLSGGVVSIMPGYQQQLDATTFGKSFLPSSTDWAPSLHISLTCYLSLFKMVELMQQKLELHTQGHPDQSSDLRSRLYPHKWGWPHSVVSSLTLTLMLWSVVTTSLVWPLSLWNVVGTTEKLLFTFDNFKYWSHYQDSSHLLESS